MEKIVKISIIFDKPKLGYIVHIVYTKQRKKVGEFLTYVKKSKLKEILEAVVDEI